MDIQTKRNGIDDSPVAGDDAGLLQSLDAGAGRGLRKPDPASDLGSGQSAFGLEQGKDVPIDAVK